MHGAVDSASILPHPEITHISIQDPYLTPHTCCCASYYLLLNAQQFAEEVGEHGQVPVDQAPGVERRRRQLHDAVPAPLHLRDAVPVHHPKIPVHEPARDQRGGDAVHGGRRRAVRLLAGRVGVPLVAGEGGVAVQRARGARRVAVGRQRALGAHERVEVHAVRRVGHVAQRVLAELVHEPRAGRLLARGVHGHGGHVGARGCGRDAVVDECGREEDEGEEEGGGSCHGHEVADLEVVHTCARDVVPHIRSCLVLNVKL